MVAEAFRYAAAVGGAACTVKLDKEQVKPMKMANVLFMLFRVEKRRDRKGSIDSAMERLLINDHMMQIPDLEKMSQVSERRLIRRPSEELKSGRKVPSRVEQGQVRFFFICTTDCLGRFLAHLATRGPPFDVETSEMFKQTTATVALPPREIAHD